MKHLLSILIFLFATGSASGQFSIAPELGFSDAVMSFRFTGNRADPYWPYNSAPGVMGITAGLIVN